MLLLSNSRFLSGCWNRIKRHPQKKDEEEKNKSSGSSFLGNKRLRKTNHAHLCAFVSKDAFHNYVHVPHAQAQSSWCKEKPWKGIWPVSLVKLFFLKMETPHNERKAEKKAIRLDRKQGQLFFEVKWVNALVRGSYCAWAGTTCQSCFCLSTEISVQVSLSAM